MKNLLTLIALFCFSVPFLAAQKSSAVLIDEWKIYGGYQFTSLDSHSVQDALNLFDPGLHFGRRQDLNGLNAGIQEDITKWFGVVVDVGSGFGEKRILLDNTGGVNTSTRTKMKVYTFTGGPQFTLYRGERFQPFVRALVGGAFLRSRTDEVQNNVPIISPVHIDDEGFTGGAGAGSDIFFSRHFALRVAADWFHTGWLGESQNNLRATSALVFKF